MVLVFSFFFLKMVVFVGYLCLEEPSQIRMSLYFETTLVEKLSIKVQFKSY